MVTGTPSDSNSGSNDAGRRWEGRIERARTLQGNQQAFAAALLLYEATLEFQREVALESRSAFNPELPLRTQIDIPFACSKLGSILSVARKHGPEPLHLRARTLQDEGETVWCGLFESALGSHKTILSQIDDYFVRACLQPIAENLQSQQPPDRNYNDSVCPACGGLPQLAVLRPEGEGASRSLLCSFCLCEWLFRRIICPWCGEEDRDKLPRYSTEERSYVHVEACDTCHRYLKAVDMSIDGRAVPLVDEAALAVLDVWAVGRGYKKIVPNLIGF